METRSENVIIADTSGLVSLLLPGDHNHKEALKAARQLQAKQKSIRIPAAVFVGCTRVLLQHPYAGAKDSPHPPDRVA